MPDVSGAASAASAVVGVGSAVSGANAASDANRLQEKQLELAKDRDKFNKGVVEKQNKWTKKDRQKLNKRIKREQKLLDPVQENLVEMAMEGPNYDEVMARSDADVAQSYGLQRDRMRRDLRRYGGFDPTSGAMMSEERRFANEEALARVGGRDKARVQEENRDWARKVAALGTGNLRNTTPGGHLTQLGVPSSIGAYGNAAGVAADNSSSAYSLAGSMFADSVDNARHSNWNFNRGGDDSTSTPDPGDYTYWE